jgi:formylglycine-generating enzyme required for sulfatase activity
MKREVDPIHLEDNGNLRALRGGGWFYDAGGCRATCRCGGVASLRFDVLGFRLVLKPLELEEDDDEERDEERS